MTPEPLVQALWDDLNQDLLWLALLHLSVVTFAGSILFGRAVVPSLVYTGHASERVGRLQPVFYAMAAVAGLAVIVLASLWIDGLDVLWDGVYDRIWI
jgi:hypothetical protein